MGTMQQERIRRQKRVGLVRACTYEMTEAHDRSTVMLHQGEALSVNVSSGGMMLFMPHTPRVGQIFEVIVPAATGKRDKGLTLVEVRWAKEIVVDSGASMTFVGVKFLMSITNSAPKRFLN